MYSVEEFDREKTKILKYIMYKKRTENEVRNKFKLTIEENLLEDIIDYLKETRYISDGDINTIVIPTEYRNYIKNDTNRQIIVY